NGGSGGNLNVNAGVNNSELRLNGVNANVTLDGTGLVTLSQSAGGIAYIRANNAGQTLTSNITIAGVGTMDNSTGNSYTFINGTGTLFANVNGGTLHVNNLTV